MDEKLKKYFGMSACKRSINSKPDKVGHWIIFLLINFLLVFLFTYFYPKGVFEGEGMEVGADLFVLFALVNGLLGTLYFFLFSMFFKRWSSNGSVTPFKANIP